MADKDEDDRKKWPLHRVMHVRSQGEAVIAIDEIFGGAPITIFLAGMRNWRGDSDRFMNALILYFDKPGHPGKVRRKAIREYLGSILSAMGDEGEDTDDRPNTKVH